MPLVSIYCIDTSSLIEAKRAYPPTVLPDLWTNLESLIKQGRLRAPSSVRDEVRDRSNELAEWVRRQPNMFVPESDLVVLASRVISETGLIDHTKTADADPFLVALALQVMEEKPMYQKPVVVTQEHAKSGRKDIPNACRHYVVDCIDLLDMMQAEGWKFVNG